MYIHEKDDWTNFTWAPDKLAPLLGNVRHLQGRLLGQMEQLGFELTTESTVASLTFDVVDTSIIEGVMLNPEQVRSSIAHKLGIENVDYVPTPQNVDGIVNILLDATQNFAQPLTQERLFGWHNALFPGGFGGLTKIDVAKYRSGGMKVVSGAFGREKIHFEAPHPTRLDGEMKDFLAWFNKNAALDKVLKAAIAHLWFVTLHPFDDGNGRLARAIMDMQLARSDNSALRFYSMSNQIYKDHSKYNEVLERTQKGDGDITAWLNWFLTCFEKALLASQTNLAMILDKAKFWNQFQLVPINDRQRLMLNHLYANYDKETGYLRTSSWAKTADCSTDTALRDLQDLVQKGMLIAEDSGKKTNYLVASPGKIRIPKILNNS
ncbi:cell division protein Fic [Bacteroidia bacterium]|nr:cell division protein Fic [Bacteroidia bacterium]